jgi:hypothetical protein
MEYYLLQPYIARLLLIANFDSAVCSQLTLDHNNNNEKHGNVEAYIVNFLNKLIVSCKEAVRIPILLGYF